MEIGKPLREHIVEEPKPIPARPERVPVEPNPQRTPVPERVPEKVGV